MNAQSSNSNVHPRPSDGAWATATAVMEERKAAKSLRALSSKSQPHKAVKQSALKVREAGFHVPPSTSPRVEYDCFKDPYCPWAIALQYNTFMGSRAGGLLTGLPDVEATALAARAVTATVDPLRERIPKDRWELPTATKHQQPSPSRPSITTTTIARPQHTTRTQEGMASLSNTASSIFAKGATSAVVVPRVAAAVASVKEPFTPLNVSWQESDTSSAFELTCLKVVVKREGLLAEAKRTLGASGVNSAVTERRAEQEEGEAVAGMLQAIRASSFEAVDAIEAWRVAKGMEDELAGIVAARLARTEARGLSPKEWAEKQAVKQLKLESMLRLGTNKGSLRLGADSKSPLAKRRPKSPKQGETAEGEAGGAGGCSGGGSGGGKSREPKSLRVAPRAFLYQQENYLLKMVSDCDFLANSSVARQALGMERGRGCRQSRSRHDDESDDSDEDEDGEDDDDDGEEQFFSSSTTIAIDPRGNPFLSPVGGLAARAKATSTATSYRAVGEQEQQESSLTPAFSTAELALLSSATLDPLKLRQAETLVLAEAKKLAAALKKQNKNKNTTKPKNKKGGGEEEGSKKAGKTTPLPPLVTFTTTVGATTTREGVVTQQLPHLSPASSPSSSPSSHSSVTEQQQQQQQQQQQRPHKEPAAETPSQKCQRLPVRARPWLAAHQPSKTAALALRVTQLREEVSDRAQGVGEAEAEAASLKGQEERCRGLVKQCEDKLLADRNHHRQKKEEEEVGKKQMEDMVVAKEKGASSSPSSSLSAKERRSLATRKVLLCDDLAAVASKARTHRAALCLEKLELTRVRRLQRSCEEALAGKLATKPTARMIMTTSRETALLPKSTTKTAAVATSTSAAKAMALKKKDGKKKTTKTENSTGKGNVEEEVVVEVGGSGVVVDSKKSSTTTGTATAAAAAAAADKSANMDGVGTATVPSKDRPSAISSGGGGGGGGGDCPTVSVVGVPAAQLNAKEEEQTEQQESAKEAEEAKEAVFETLFETEEGGGGDLPLSPMLLSALSPGGEDDEDMQLGIFEDSSYVDPSDEALFSLDDQDVQAGEYGVVGLAGPEEGGVFEEGDEEYLQLPFQEGNDDDAVDEDELLFVCQEDAFFGEFDEDGNNGEDHTGDGVGDGNKKEEDGVLVLHRLEGEEEGEEEEEEEEEGEEEVAAMGRRRKEGLLVLLAVAATEAAAAEAAAGTPSLQEKERGAALLLRRLEEKVALKDLRYQEQWLKARHRRRSVKSDLAVSNSGGGGGSGGGRITFDADTLLPPRPAAAAAAAAASTDHADASEANGDVHIKAAVGDEKGSVTMTLLGQHSHPEDFSLQSPEHHQQHQMWPISIDAIPISPPPSSSSGSSSRGLLLSSQWPSQGSAVSMAGTDDALNPNSSAVSSVVGSTRSSWSQQDFQQNSPFTGHGAAVTGAAVTAAAAAPAAAEAAAAEAATATALAGGEGGGSVDVEMSESVVWVPAAPLTTHVAVKRRYSAPPVPFSSDAHLNAGKEAAAAAASFTSAQQQLWRGELSQLFKLCNSSGSGTLNTTEVAFLCAESPLLTASSALPALSSPAAAVLTAAVVASAAETAVAESLLTIATTAETTTMTSSGSGGGSGGGGVEFPLFVRWVETALAWRRQQQQEQRASLASMTTTAAADDDDDDKADLRHLLLVMPRVSLVLGFEARALLGLLLKFRNRNRKEKEGGQRALLSLSPSLPLFDGDDDDVSENGGDPRSNHDCGNRALFDVDAFLLNTTAYGLNDNDYVEGHSAVAEEENGSNFHASGGDDNDNDDGSEVRAAAAAPGETTQHQEDDTDSEGVLV